MRKAHSPHLLALEVDDGVLAPVLEAVLVGGHRVVGQQLSEPVTRHVLRVTCNVPRVACNVSPVRAARVHEVGEELHVARPELLLALHVHVGEVTLADLRTFQMQCYVLRVTRDLCVHDLNRYLLPTV